MKILYIYSVYLCGGVVAQIIFGDSSDDSDDSDDDGFYGETIVREYGDGAESERTTGAYDFDEKQDSIIGGTPTSIKTVPYQAVILKYTYVIGAGTIIGRRYILATAYEVRPYDVDELNVRVGSDDPLHAGQLINVTKKMVHEDYDDRAGNDVALLRLERDITYHELSKPIRMTTRTARHGTTAVVSGFSISEANIMEHNSLKKGKQQIMSVNQCKRYYDADVLGESNICARNPKVCACHNDFGAPLVQNNLLVGFFIGGSTCCQDQNPQIYNDVAYSLGWVKKHFQRDKYDMQSDEPYYYRN